MSEYELLEFGVDAGIATITLNRPDTGNAFLNKTPTEILGTTD
jgi:enoyl-CoA hydratase/carnithine racemase